MFKDPKIFAKVVKRAREEKDRAGKIMGDIDTQIIAISYLAEAGDSLQIAARKCLNQATLNRLQITADQLGTFLCQLRERA